MKRTLIMPALLLLAAAVLLAGNALGRRTASAEERAEERERWEYLVVSSAHNNLTPTGNPSMRKEPGAFGREAFVLEQALDKMGAKGWELVSVSGPASEPIYYFKRRK